LFKVTKGIREKNKPLSTTSNIILGIDPGTTIMGFGLIKVVGKKNGISATQ
jgi:predicted RNase H-like nuclease (RuvC/YqgF family)